MKFGLHFHRHQVPQWTAFYKDYNALKKLFRILRANNAQPEGEADIAGELLDVTV